jgi:hypothetical protein
VTKLTHFLYTQGGQLMIISNTQRNDYYSYLLSAKLNNTQLLFVCFLYNHTIELSKARLRIPNISKLSSILEIDRSNLIHDINKLIQRNIIIKEKNVYAINLDFSQWQVDKKIFQKIRNHSSSIIKYQLDN